MKKIVKGLAMALCSVAASAVLADSSVPADQRVEINAQPGVVSAAQAVMALRDLDAIYEMSSGRRMEVSSAGDALNLRYGRLTAATLRYDGQGRFVSQDRKVVLQFQLDRSGSPEQVRLSLPANWQ
jgi:hypothetical protein